MDAAQRTMQALLETIGNSPIPTTPLARNRHSEDRGLALLELSSRFDHVRRQSEHLVLVDRGHLQRSISLDVDLSRLSTRQFRALAGRTAAESGPTKVWLPIANQFRGDLAPVIVRDANSVARPRMTLHEMVTASSAALVKLFTMLLDASPEAESGSGVLHRLQHENHRSRWLIEASIGALIEIGPAVRRHDSGVDPETAAGTEADAHPDHGAVAAGPGDRRPGDDEERPVQLPSQAEPVRAFAVKALTALQASQPNSFLAFLELLCAAIEEYPLAVLLDTGEANVFLTYDAPLLPARKWDVRARRRPLGRQLKPLLSPVRTFDVSYLTTVSRSTSSHHVTLEVPDQIHVRRFYMSSDCDAPMVGRLIADMKGVADHYADLEAAGEKLLENELQSIAARIAELGTRRARDAQRYQGYLTDKGVRRAPALAGPSAHSTDSLADFAAGRGSPLADLSRFSQAFQDGQYTRLAGVLTPLRLRVIAARIDALGLSHDLTVDNDPREHGAHGHRSRRPLDKDAQAMEPVRAWVHLSLVDDPPSLASSVTRMILALMVVVYTLLAVLTQDWWWPAPGRVGPVTFSQADATVAVLLLVPGLMLTRLDIPATNTVLGQIRLLHRILAYGAVGTLAVMAAVVATGKAVDSLALSALFAMLAVLAVFSGCTHVMARRAEGDTAPRDETIPQWVRAEFGEQLTSRLAPASVSFVVTRRHDRAQ